MKKVRAPIDPPPKSTVFTSGVLSHKCVELRDLHQKHGASIKVQVGEMEFETERKEQGNADRELESRAMHEGCCRQSVGSRLLSVVVRPALWLRF